MKKRLPHKRPKSKQLLPMTSNIVFDSFSIRFLVNNIQKNMTAGTSDETLNDQEGLMLP